MKQLRKKWLFAGLIFVVACGSGASAVTDQQGNPPESEIDPIAYEYKIGTANTPEKLELRIRTLLNEGWSLQGGASTALYIPPGNNGSYVAYLQALKRERTGEVEK